MNYSIIRRTTGLVLKFEAIFLLLPALTGFVYRERQGLVYLALAAAYFAIGFLINLKGDTGTEFYTKEIYRIIPTHCLRRFPALRRQGPVY